VSGYRRQGSITSSGACVDASPTERHTVPTSLSFFASQTVPIETNSIWFGPDGMPAHRDFKSPVAFSFACGGVTLTARAGREDDEAWLEVEGDLGALPFSAESRDTRSEVIAILLAARLTDHRYFGVGPDQHIRLHGEIPLTCPLTPASILTGITQFSLAVRPFIELLNEARPARPAP
jgi:hypothetical protein